MKITTIAKSKALTTAKLKRLTELASRLGKLRTEIWNEFGSIKGVNLTHRQIRDNWLIINKSFNVPARLWKETLRDVIDDIHLYCEAAKEKVRKAIAKRYTNKKIQKAAYSKLKSGQWVKDNYLRRMMRKYFKHGHTSVKNQIILDSDCYTAFTFGGKAWIDVMSLEKGNRIAIPLTTNRLPSGTLRLIVKTNYVEVHYAINSSSQCNILKSGDSPEIGVDKGYSEVFVDSEAEVHGEGLGLLLSAESDRLNVKYQRRNKLRSIADKKPHKAAIINKHNLGQQKLDKRKAIHKARVKKLILKAVHSVVDKAKEIVCEDLTATFQSSKPMGKNQKRRLSGWVKGMIADALEQVSLRRGASVIAVNAAYTSQACSSCGCLGRRSGDAFYCINTGCGVVLQADRNAAVNIKLRKNDPEIGRWMPFSQVKSILLERSRQRLGLLNQDSRYLEEAILGDITSAHSESELPNVELL
jgi:IS605 OrfB family transposase